jgi:hypothetical protein
MFDMSVRLSVIGIRCFYTEPWPPSSDTELVDMCRGGRSALFGIK